MQRDEAFERQLQDITNLLQEQADTTARNKEENDQRWMEKAERRENKQYQLLEIREIVQKLHEDMMDDRTRAEQERLNTATKDGVYGGHLLRALTDNFQIFAPSLNSCNDKMTNNVNSWRCSLIVRLDLGFVFSFDIDGVFRLARGLCSASGRNHQCCQGHRPRASSLQR